MRAGKTLVSLCTCMDTPEQSLLNDAISTKILLTDPSVLLLCDRMVNCLDQDQTASQAVQF